MAAVSSDNRAAIIAAAREWRGTPYHHRASLKGVGCDCLGLVRGVWREIVGPEPVSTPAYSADWGDVTGTETLLQAAHQFFEPTDLAQPGDVLIFRVREDRIAKHCGILTTDTTFIHAWEAAPVAEVSLGRWWRSRIVSSFRFPEAE